MTRAEIKDDLRRLCPEISATVLTDAALNSMLLVGDKEVAARTRCIVGDYTWECADDEQYWDLTTKIPTFYAIDSFPGGGVCFDDEALEEITIAELDQKSSNWRSRTSGDPDYYWTRGKMLWFDRPVKTGADIQVYFAAVSDDFNSDDITPFNQLSYLEPFHNSLVLYLVMRAKSKVGKMEESAMAKQEYENYLMWMRKEIISSKKGVVHIQPKW
jgi:hypothetical protein